MKHYELLCIIPARYTEGELAGVEGKITDLVKKYEGEITLTKNLGNIKLAYPIKGTQNAVSLVIEFNADPLKIKDLDSILKLTPEVLRHQLANKKLKTQAEIDKEKLRKEKMEQRLIEKEKQEAEASSASLVDEIKVEAEEKKEASTKQPKVSLEELDKKLGEILSGDII